MQRSPIKKLALRFDDPELEQDFLQWHSSNSVLYQRGASIGGALGFFVGFFWLRWAIPELPVARVQLILAVPVSLMVLAFFSTFFDAPDWLRQLVVLLTLAGSYGLVLGLLIIAPAEAVNSPLSADINQLFQYLGLPAMMIMMVVASTFIRQRFRYALVSTPAGIVLYLFAASVSGASSAAVANNLIVLILLCVNVLSLAYIFERSLRNEYSQAVALQRERDKSERLLTNILPRSVAKQLKDEGRTTAKKYQQVSILFADLVGFTELAARLDPAEVVRVLNLIFTEFDEVCDESDLEKIKTIGDAYMVAAGVPAPDPAHATKVLGAAKRMVEIVDRLSVELDEKIEIRIGINSGEVVAGVIGIRKFSYDLWGDTVNTASRLEATGLPGRIQVGRATYELTKQHCQFDPPRIVHLKGKGDVEVWLAAVEPADLVVDLREGLASDRVATRETLD